jgi:hypothetical protein
MRECLPPRCDPPPCFNAINHPAPLISALVHVSLLAPAGPPVRCPWRMSKTCLPAYGRGSYPSTSTRRRRVVQSQQSRQITVPKKCAGLCSPRVGLPLHSAAVNLRPRPGGLTPARRMGFGSESAEGPESELVIEAQAGDVRGEIGGRGESVWRYRDGITVEVCCWSARD